LDKHCYTTIEALEKSPLKTAEYTEYTIFGHRGSQPAIKTGYRILRPRDVCDGDHSIIIDVVVLIPQGFITCPSDRQASVGEQEKVAGLPT
jgi:hypothetical protein